MESQDTRASMRAALGALEESLSAELGGLRALDRDLELFEAPGLGLEGDVDARGARRADLVAIDRRGRLVLVLLVDGGAPECVHAALDALYVLQHGARALTRHLLLDRDDVAQDEAAFETRLDARGELDISESQGRVLLVAERFAPHVLRALELVGPPRPLCFELRGVRSASHESAHLERVDAGRVVCTPSEFLARLPAPANELGQLALRKVARLDDAFALECDATAVTITYRGEALGALARDAAGLTCEIAGKSGSRPLRNRSDLDAWIEALLRRHLRGLGEPVRTAAGAGDALRTATPVLSADELAAFRD